MWLERLDKMVPGSWNGCRHQSRDTLYKHGSVAEDWDAIQCPRSMPWARWTDGLSNAGLPPAGQSEIAPRQGAVGPWAHNIRISAVPRPAIGSSQECPALVGSLAEGPRHGNQ